jgi:hypothetical protein
MQRQQRSELLKAIEEARSAEDRAWALAAEARRKNAGDEELLETLRLVEATTAQRMKLEQDLKLWSP